MLLYEHERRNIGRRRRKNANDRGYWLDTIEGKWLSDKQAADAPVDTDDFEADMADAKTKAKVIPYVEDTRNIATVRFGRQLDESESVTLRYALERGLEAEFQLEDSELESQSLPDAQHRGRMLFMESAEGGAGALRQLVVESNALARAARRALAICHFDPDTGDDVGVPEGRDERCERGCYDCLLSFRNQIEHSLIDRTKVRALLLELSSSLVVAGGGGQSPSAQLEHLGRFADSSLEHKFLDWLSTNGYRMPDQAQLLVTDCQAKPDFTYSAGPTAVFIDGPVHDGPAQAERDMKAQLRLEDAGWTVIRFRHNDDWPSVAATLQSVFGGPSNRTRPNPISK